MRPSLDATYIKMALLMAERGTCARRQVGCILADDTGKQLASGYNGPPSGEQHCVDFPCPGATAAPGESLDLCEAVHAEMNAIANCREPWNIYTCYCTVSPCLTCVKLLMNTGCHRIVFAEEYAHDDLARERWLRINPHHIGRTWELFA